MLDEFGLYPREEPFDPFSVMLFKALQVIYSCFSSRCWRSRRRPRTARSISKAEFIVTMDWPDKHPDDLDLFVQDPAGNITWYRHREAGFLVLDRDDRGGANNSIVVNGKKIASPIREEIVTICGIVAGEYTVNVSHFAAMTGLPVPVKVKVQKLNPTVQVIHENTLFVDHTGDEKTAVRFTIDAEGKVTDVNYRAKSLMATSAALISTGPISIRKPATGKNYEQPAIHRAVSFHRLCRAGGSFARGLLVHASALAGQGWNDRRHQRLLRIELFRYAVVAWLVVR